MNAVEVAELSKRYALGEGGHKYSTLREAILGRVTRRAAAPARDLWALRDVSFEVPTGEILGVIGRNGAGKSTLLKVLTRITAPTQGMSRTRGRVGALLEVGTGFHPELTGRENVYLNAALLGLSRRETSRRFESIVDFAGVERFLDTPVKRYSSGMELRLAFAVAAHLEPDIVVVDEVLAVGDAEFQRKCLGVMDEFHRRGRTVVFVSHDLGAVTRLCQRAIWLEQGQIRADGVPEDVVDEYLRLGRGDQPLRADSVIDLGDVRLLEASISEDPPDSSLQLRRGAPLCVRVALDIVTPMPGLDVAVWVLNRQGIRLLDEAWSDVRDLADIPTSPGVYQFDLELPPLLTAGTYTLGIWIGNEYVELIDDEVLRFEIEPRPDDLQETLERQRVIQPPVRWHMEPR